MYQHLTSGDALKTATLKVTAEGMEEGSTYLAEIDLSLLNCNETGTAVEFAAILDVQAEFTSGLLVRRVNFTRHNSDTPRYNTVKRLFLEFQNTSGDALSFEEMEVTLYGLSLASRPSGTSLSSLSALAGNTSPILVTDGDGAELTAYWQSIT